MDLRLLGPLEVRLGDGPIELGPRKQRAVLAMLALRVGRTVSVDALIEGLWGEQPPASAPKMVQLYISHLRPLLDGNGARILTRPRGYELEVADGGIDAARFEQLVEDARRREALALWRGDALEDVADEPFAAPEIRRLDELRLRATEMAIDADLAAGRHADVIGELAALVAAHPLREHLHAQRMLALYRAGRQSEALAAYRRRVPRSWSRSASSPAPSCGGCTRQCSRRTRRSTSPRRPRSPRRWRRDRRRAGAPTAARRRRRPPGRRRRGVRAHPAPRARQPPGHPGGRRRRHRSGGSRITAQYGVGRTPDAVTSGGGSVWVANQLDGTVSRIDRANGEVVTIPVGGAPAALAFGAGRCGRPTATAARSRRSTPGRTRSSSRSRPGTPRSRWRWQRARCGSSSGATAPCAGSRSAAPAPRARSPLGARPLRSRPARERSG